MALAGRRLVVGIMYLDFVTCAMYEALNQATRGIRWGRRSRGSATLAWIGDADEALPERTDETAAAPEAVSGERWVTPVARRLAERHGVDADRPEGTGPGGRVAKEDVTRAIDERMGDMIGA